MRGQQLSELVFNLRAETGNATSTAVGVDALHGLKALLRSTQEMLWLEHDWPFLRSFAVVEYDVGARFIDVPAAMSIEGLRSIHVKWGGRWQAEPLTRGIDTEEYSAFDSIADERTDPLQRWDVRYSADAEGPQIELWPLPATAGSVRIKGRRDLEPFISDTDRCTLDGNLIVLTAAVEILARTESKDAERKAARAAQLLARLKAGSSGGSETIVFGGGQPPRGHRGHITIAVR